MKKESCEKCRYCKTLYKRHAFSMFYSIAFPKYYCALSHKMSDRKTACEHKKSKNRNTPVYDVSVERLKQVEEDIKAVMAYFENR